MTSLARWTWIAAAILVLVPPVVFVLFLRDARRIFDDLRSAPADGSPPTPSDPSSGGQIGGLA
ncbi:MAG: hypothetical protein AMS20_07930 [Gemmatimonas sp. SG8_28]|nr:MAG: hypothetical protein AMS20_07930 [Gemmatimonas sp. SG8_28]